MTLFSNASRDDAGAEVSFNPFA